jgi:hypothetical protein
MYVLQLKIDIDMQGKNKDYVYDLICNTLADHRIRVMDDKDAPYFINVSYFHEEEDFLSGRVPPLSDYPLPKIDEIWVDNRSRNALRHVKILALDLPNKLVQIQTVYSTNPNTNYRKVTVSKLSRFNGNAHGYAFYAGSLSKCHFPTLDKGEPK